MTTAQTLPMAIPLPMAAGSLETYIQSVNRFPLLSAEQEQDFARRYREEGDVRARASWCSRTCGWWWRWRAATWAMACRTPT